MPNLRLQHKALFRVSSGTLQNVAFSKCSPIRVEAELVTHRAGGTLLANKFPGLVTVPPITLERGLVQIQNQLYNWFRKITDVTNLNVELGGIGISFESGDDIAEKQDLRVDLLRRTGNVTRSWILRNAFPTVFEVDELDNDANEALIERLVLEYDIPEEEGTPSPGGADLF